MTSVVAGSMALLLVVLLAYPLMLAGIGQASPTCAEVGGSHEPMSDTRMSCCSSATQPQSSRRQRRTHRRASRDGRLCSTTPGLS